MAYFNLLLHFNILLYLNDQVSTQYVFNNGFPQIQSPFSQIYRSNIFGFNRPIYSRVNYPFEEQIDDPFPLNRPFESIYFPISRQLFANLKKKCRKRYSPDIEYLANTQIINSNSRLPSDNANPSAEVGYEYEFRDRSHYGIIPFGQLLKRKSSHLAENSPILATNIMKTIENLHKFRTPSNTTTKMPVITIPGLRRFNKLENNLDNSVTSYPSTEKPATPEKITANEHGQSSSGQNLFQSQIDQDKLLPFMSHIIQNKSDFLKVFLNNRKNHKNRIEKLQTNTGMTSKSTSTKSPVIKSLDLELSNNSEQLSNNTTNAVKFFSSAEQPVTIGNTSLNEHDQDQTRSFKNMTDNLSKINEDKIFQSILSYLIKNKRDFLRLLLNNHTKNENRTEKLQTTTEMIVSTTTTTTVKPVVQKIIEEQPIINVPPLEPESVVMDTEYHNNLNEVIKNSSKSSLDFNKAHEK